MFGYVKERKAVAALDAVAPGVAEAAGSATPAQRAAALAVANAMLLAGTAQWGRNFAHAPMKLGREASCDAVCVLADRHAQLEAAVSGLAGRPAGDPQVAACKWEILATQAVMVTAGAVLSREYAESAREVWRLLGASRGHAHEAVKLLTRHSKAYSVQPVPPLNGRPADAARLLSLASSLPPMFRTAKERR